jgi:hypothetical protein
MKFLITWQIHEGKLHDTLALFSQMTELQERALMTDDVRLLSRWHDLIRGTGAAVYEAASVEALSAYALNWNRFMDLDISAVVDDDGARALGKQLKKNP